MRDETAFRYAHAEIQNQVVVIWARRPFLIIEDGGVEYREIIKTNQSPKNMINYVFNDNEIIPHVKYGWNLKPTHLFQGLVGYLCNVKSGSD